MEINDVINTSELQERLDSDFVLLTELIDIFLKDSQALLIKIEDAISQDDAEKLNKSAHTLKGAVSNFSARSAFEAAYALEKIGKSGDLANAEPALSVLKDEIEKTRDAMKALRKKGAF